MKALVRICILLHRASQPFHAEDKAMMRFPIDALLDEQSCYDFLRKVLHPEGLHCPKGHPLPEDQAPHDRHRVPICDYKCRVCGKVYNIFTGTTWCGSRYSCGKIVLILRGILQGRSTKSLAQELGIDRSHLNSKRHTLQKLAEQRLSPLAPFRPSYRS